MFTHVHYVNGVMITHSHPSKDKQHTHTKTELVVIHHLSTVHTLEATSCAIHDVLIPVLYDLEIPLATSFVISIHLQSLSLRAPPAI